jgi:hypothetical protein
MRIVFLHIPKTAGQSVHAALANTFGEAAVCPARVNEQLRLMSISELNRYQVFSGHFDWSLLDCLKGPRYVFTILREPMERVLSFYFFLRKQGEQMSAEQRAKPSNSGVRAAYEMSPLEYFTGGPPHLRNFLDDHYDNFYTHYFAGRHYRARAELAGPMQRGEVTRQQLLTLAKDNMAQLDAVFSVNDITRVFETIQGLGGRAIKGEGYRTNVNQEVAPSRRLARLQALGADEKTLKRLDAYCELDRELWSIYGAPGSGASSDEQD